MINKLIFVDTNILLDFYRCRTEAGILLLDHLEKIRDQVITTYQVEMEFKKHRQEVIQESVKSLKAVAGISVPSLFSSSTTTSSLKRSLRTADKKITKLRQRLHGIFQNPTTHDPVYKAAQRLFLKEDDISLTREKKVRYSVRRRAWKRFVLGFPPRKQGDTSIGDAINWEWMVDCAKLRKAELIIVSRDSDYGTALDTGAFINDWLLQEFRARVSKKRKVSLFTRLSEALKQFSIEVTDAEAKEEREISAPKSIALDSSALADLIKKLSIGSIFQPSTASKLSDLYIAPDEPAKSQEGSAPQIVPPELP